MRLPSRFVPPSLLMVFIPIVLGAGGLAGCNKPHKVTRCYTAADCGSTEICSELESGARTCLDACDSVAAATCTSGASCVTIGGEDAQVDVCLPGGDTVLGAACTTSVECVLGAICVQRAGFPTPRCEKLCTPDAPSACVGNEACTAVDASTSSTRGTCIIPGT